MIQPIERMHSEKEKLIAELAESFGWRDEWLQDEELCQKQTEMQCGSADGEGGPKARQWE